MLPSISDKAAILLLLLYPPYNQESPRFESHSERVLKIFLKTPKYWFFPLNGATKLHPLFISWAHQSEPITIILPVLLKQYP